MDTKTLPMSDAEIVEVIDSVSESPETSDTPVASQKKGRKPNVSEEPTKQKRTYNKSKSDKNAPMRHNGGIKGSRDVVDKLTGTIKILEDEIKKLKETSSSSETIRKDEQFKYMVDKLAASEAMCLMYWKHIENVSQKQQ